MLRIDESDDHPRSSSDGLSLGLCMDYWIMC